MSLWINQSKEKPCQRVRKRDKPAGQEKQKKNRVNVLENVTNRGEEICNILSDVFIGEIVCRTMM